MLFVYVALVSKEEVITKYVPNTDRLGIFQFSLFTLVFSHINSDFKMKSVKVLKNPYVTAYEGQYQHYSVGFYSSSSCFDLGGAAMLPVWEDMVISFMFLFLC